MTLEASQLLFSTFVFSHLSRSLSSIVCLLDCSVYHGGFSSILIFIRIFTTVNPRNKKSLFAFLLCQSMQLQCGNMCICNFIQALATVQHKVLVVLDSTFQEIHPTSALPSSSPVNLGDLLPQNPLFYHLKNEGITERGSKVFEAITTSILKQEKQKE